MKKLPESRAVLGPVAAATNTGLRTARLSAKNRLNHPSSMIVSRTTSSMLVMPS
jgi:hypothetical protein